MNGGEWSKLMEGVMCCRRKLKGLTGGCDREEKEENDRQREG